jgi:hypothetical protein
MTQISDFYTGKTEYSISLLDHFILEFRKIGEIDIIPAKTMIGIATRRKRIAYVTQIGKNFIHVVFPFKESHPDNLCFQKIAQVPGDAKQFNHHFRMLHHNDVNEEVKEFMAMALKDGS